MNTREQLIEACVTQVASDGVAALSLRKVAAEVGISAPSIYAHFDSKEALLAAAQGAALEALQASLQAHTTGRAAQARLVGAAMGYLAFAQEHPHLFGLLFLQSPSQRRSLAEAPPPAASPSGYLLLLVEGFLGRGHPQSELLAYGIWSLVHGSAVLRQTHLKDFDGPMVQATRASVEALLRGWPRH